MSHNQRQNLAPFLQYLFYCVLGIVVLCFIAFIDYQGAFITWKPLNGQFKSKQIITANPLNIQAKTIDDKFYSFHLDNFCVTQSECNQWIEIKEGTSLSQAGDPLIERSSSCNKLKHPILFREPSGNVLECLHAEEFVTPEIRSVVYYTLLDNGKILIWDLNDSFVRSRGMGIVGILILLGGFLFGTVAFLFFKNKQRKSFSQEK